MVTLKKYILLSFLFLGSFFMTCCSNSCRNESGAPTRHPKLVVGIVIDQMRYDYLYRFWDKYGEGGFKRLLKQGYLCANTNLNYVPTYTGPGHSAIYTGTTPAINGIIANDWYDRKKYRTMYCAEDTCYGPVGSDNVHEGAMSPRNLLSSTITDELRIASNFRSKVIGISLKERASIFPSGHSANAAYWFDGQSGNWMTSTYYMNKLPKWVQDFNGRHEPVKYLKQTWKPLLGSVDKYTESTKDLSPYEGAMHGETVPVFPYNLWQASGNSYELLKETPFGDTYTKDFVKAAIKAEKMGKSDFTDFLTVSFSSTDLVGHRFGPNSIELEDTYLRLDKDLKDLLDFLDSWMGKDNVLVFLTADHGVVQIPGYLMSKGIQQPAGYFNARYIEDSLNLYLKKKYADPFLDSLMAPGMAALKKKNISHNQLLHAADSIRFRLTKAYQCDRIMDTFINQQIYLNDDFLNKTHISRDKICRSIVNYVDTLRGEAQAITGADLKKYYYGAGQFAMVQRGYYAQRSGDVAIVLKPGWFDTYNLIDPKGTTHGSGYPYDTHIPLIFYGWKIAPGRTFDPVAVTDIAPTLAAFLQIQPPSGCTGEPIKELVK